jgi:hypothetical protein
MRKRLAIGLALAGVAAAAIVALFWWTQSAGKSAAGGIASRLVTAFERHDPSLAPPGGADYVRGVWKMYRRVDSARVLTTREESVTHGSLEGSGSAWRSDMLLQTGRGLVVLELSFRSPSVDPSDQRIDLLYEIGPQRIPGGVLDAHTLARLSSDLRERGGRTGDDITLSVSGPEPASPTSAPKPGLVPPRIRIVVPPIIACLRRAHQDVTKVERCARRANGG